jgi:hypothetical protein
MLNHIANTLSANRNGLDLGISTMSSAAPVALVNMIRPSNPVRHVHPRYPREVEHGSPTTETPAVVTSLRALLEGCGGSLRGTGDSKRLEARTGPRCPRMGRVSVSRLVHGSWRSAWLAFQRFLDQVQQRQSDADARARLASDPTTGAQRLAPRFARAWVFGS